ncbi:hypothetical protein CPB83DRAFT_841362, partial [Crepidotus variabilis]
MNDNFIARDRVDMSVREFVKKFTTLQGPADAGTKEQMQAARFAVSGRLPNNKWASVNVENNCLSPAPASAEIEFTRDYDSLIGFGSALSKVKVDISVFPNPNPALNLKKDVHVTHTYHNSHSDQAETVSPHKVPNTMFGSFGARHNLRIFFPRLVSAARKKSDVETEELAGFYDHALRPAIDRVYPGTLHNWPGSFHTAQFRDMRRSGGFSNSSVILGRRSLDEFDAVLRELVDAEDTMAWAKDYFWGFEIRGLKQATKHRMGDETASQRELEHLLKEFEDPEETWYVDVGLEIGIKEKALAWMVRGHAAIVAEALGIDEAAANAIVAKTCFASDMSSCIEQLAGFRTALLSVGIDLAVYLQAYLSDKTQTYHIGGGINFRALSIMMALHGNPPIFCRNLLQVLQDASAVLDVLLRIEMR